MKVLTIGGATQDSIIEYSDPETLNLQSHRGTRSYLLLEEGKKIEVETLGNYSGGGATNSAVTFSKFGFDVATFCLVGNDSAGDFIIQDLESAGVEVNYVQKTNKVATASSFIIPSLKGDRTVFAYRGANSYLSFNLSDEDLSKFQQLYITSLSRDSASQLPDICQRAKKFDIPVAVNPGISQLKGGSDALLKALPFIDALILNSDEAKQFMVTLIKAEEVSQKAVKSTAKSSATEQCPELLSQLITHEDITFRLRHFIKEVLNFGPKIVVVTNGDEGVYVATPKKVMFHPAAEVESVNTIGAGDAFSSSLIAGLLRGEGLDHAIRYGVINSASVVGYKDAKTGLLPYKDLKKQVDDLEAEQLQIFDL